MGTLHVSDETEPLRVGYSHLIPGPGALTLLVDIGWWVAPQGFRSIGVTLQERVPTQFTWVAAK
jgi:hypothetical protein